MNSISKYKSGEKFQEKTKYIRQMIFDRPDWSIKPKLYKTYPEKTKISLPNPHLQTMTTVHDALLNRRSIRSYSKKPLTIDQLSYLLWASTGISYEEHGYQFRTAPSAGALYPIETYIIINNVKDINPGLYHYQIQSHQLEELKRGFLGEKIADASLQQTMCAMAAVVFIWTALFNRSKCKYGQRAFRYIYLDAAHIAANLALSATSMRLGSCQIAAFYDEEVNALLGLDETEESTIYISVIGHLEHNQDD